MLAQRVFVFDEVEVLHEAHHEGVGVCVAADVVHLRLLVVAQIAHAEGCPSYRDVEGEQLTHRRLVMQGGEPYHLVVVAQGEDFVVRLLVTRGEHRSHEGDVHLVTYGEGPSSDAELVERHRRGGEVDVCLGLCRVVGVARVVDEAQVPVAQSAHEDTQVPVYREVVVQSVGPVHHPGELAAGAGPVLGVGEVALHHALGGDTSAEQLGHAHAFVQEASFDARIFGGGQVGVQYLCVTDAHQRGACHEVVDGEAVVLLTQRGDRPGEEDGEEQDTTSHG